MQYSYTNILLGIYRKSSPKCRDKQGMPNLKAIGRRVKELRGSLRQDELALELGVSQGQLSKIESGKVPPTLGVLVLLAQKFETSIDWIVLGKRDREI